MSDREARDREHYFNDHTRSPVRERPHWMSHDQWDQATNYMKGRAIPTDPEIVSALRGERYFQEDDRGHQWAWTAVPALMVAEGYIPWCALILEKYDPDLMVAEGL